MGTPHSRDSDSSKHKEGSTSSAPDDTGAGILDLSMTGKSRGSSHSPSTQGRSKESSSSKYANSRGGYPAAADYSSKDHFDRRSDDKSKSQSAESSAQSAKGGLFVNTKPTTPAPNPL